VPRAASDPEAQIAPFADPNVATRIAQIIDQGLTEPGARDMSDSLRENCRLVEFERCKYLLPTIILCDNSDHGMANREFMFPFASVVPVKRDQLPKALGPSLV